jgi:hypothetical protein
MNKRKKTILIALIVGALLVGTVGTAFAWVSSVKSACLKPNLTYNGVAAPQACLKATYELSGGYVRVKTKWITKQSKVGWTLNTKVGPICSPHSCGVFGTGVESVAATWEWVAGGKVKARGSCAQGADAISDVLYWTKSCGW